MAKKKGKGQGKGMTAKDSAIAADRVANSGFSGFGTNARKIRAQKNVQSLVSKGYRLNPKAKTSSTYKSAVKKAATPAGRLKKLFGM